MVEWTVFCMLESDMAHAFLEGSNADMTATDTQKNTVRLSVATAWVACPSVVDRCPVAGVLCR